MTLFPFKITLPLQLAHEGMWRRGGIIMLTINLCARSESVVGSMPRLLYHCAGYSTNTDTHSMLLLMSKAKPTHPPTTIQMKIS